MIFITTFDILVLSNDQYFSLKKLCSKLTILLVWHNLYTGQLITDIVQRASLNLSLGSSGSLNKGSTVRERCMTQRTISAKMTTVNEQQGFKCSLWISNQWDESLRCRIAPIASSASDIVLNLLTCPVTTKSILTGTQVYDILNQTNYRNIETISWWSGLSFHCSAVCKTQASDPIIQTFHNETISRDSRISDSALGWDWMWDFILEAHGAPLLRRIVRIAKTCKLTKPW